MVSEWCERQAGKEKEKEIEEWLTDCAEIDIISTSAVHQSVQHIDFSLKIQKPKN